MKLTARQIGWAIRLVKEGWPYKLIARCFRCDASTISRYYRKTRRKADVDLAIDSGWDKDPYLEEMKRAERKAITEACELHSRE